MDKKINQRKKITNPEIFKKMDSNLSVKIAATATSILLSTYLLKKLWVSKKKVTGADTDVSDTTTEEKFPKEWNDLLRYCYLEDYDSIFKLINEDRLTKSILEFTDNAKWNALHVAVSKGNHAIVDLLLQTDIDVNVQNDKGYTALHIASCNGFLEIVKSLLLKDNVDCLLTSSSLESVVYLATSNQYIDIVRLIFSYLDRLSKEQEGEEGKEGEEEEDELKKKKKNKKYQLVNQYNIHGSTPLHLSVLRKNLELMRLLLDSGAEVDAVKKDGSTALHIAAVVDFVEGIDLLMHSSANTKLLNRFGNTALHDACIKSNANAVRAILAYDRSLASLVDNDKSTALHLSCNLVTSTVDSHREVIEALLYAGADVNAADAGNATPLHILCCNSGEKANELIPLLLENGANPTLENISGWTPLHHCANLNNLEALKMLSDWCAKNQSEFLDTFDVNKKKIARSRDDNAAELEDRNAEKGEDRLKRIAHDIEVGKIKNIVFLTGAGISVSSGIPAYRTKDGIYNRSKTFQFSMDSLLDDPDAFYSGVKEYFYPVVTGEFKPSKAHEFIARLNERGLLLRNFTQNVDNLDEKAGIPEERIVHAHGSFLHWYCTGCGKEEKDLQSVWKEIGRGGTPICGNRPCREVLRPGVVFFGEPLPSYFHQRAISDLRDADLLIVMGSSLQVYPFGGLPNDIDPKRPRILINSEAVGPFRGKQEEVEILLS
ncbi:ankyrin repeat-containing protein [Heterostelium album PN500]|uniref:Ankyrin repeat-containing protein n=1 Tax=Heterostelium pallidum (strain ATCC 26659 / Pp 5 / PN500) TaxID=670386 RepID=D3BD20_HETP5|nr:ankyrin repeat-containing protein [Heterostelium album PN500]EFA80812.1 ankyrin repeat-containing protein [Heterostelium album PN500]|eukprot:XP_020432931.1 ankyrin repeat-containing protein [Heterostelium album PN500]